MPQGQLRNLGRISHGRCNCDIRMSDRTWECRDWNARVSQFSRFWMRPHRESGEPCEALPFDGVARGLAATVIIRLGRVAHRMVALPHARLIIPCGMI